MNVINVTNGPFDLLFDVTNSSIDKYFEHKHDKYDIS